MSYFRQLTRGVLQAYADINVLVVATENITSEWYKGAAPAECQALHPRACVSFGLAQHISVATCRLTAASTAQSNLVARTCSCPTVWAACIVPGACSNCSLLCVGCARSRLS